MSQRILVVDDDKEIVRIIRAYLQQAGYTVLIAYDGETALHIIRSDRPDLVVLDLMMPEMDGFSVIEALRAKQETATIPIIVATAKELTPDEKNRLSGHIQALLQKGDFLNDEFLDEVRSLLK